DGTNGDEALDAAALRVGENELELADLVAAVRLRGEVVSLDPELRALRGRAEVERVDGCGELADRQPRDPRGQLRVAAEEGGGVGESRAAAVRRARRAAARVVGQDRAHESVSAMRSAAAAAHARRSPGSDAPGCLGMRAR